jgi:DNA invertase Pin-like site-specific DNA recombinase
MSKPLPKPQITLIVGYLRTSTDDQLLGIDAQEARLKQIAREKHGTIDSVFVEHESGGDNARPELEKAKRRAKRKHAYLVVAKLDRLARDQQFLLSLVNGTVPIIFGDLPDLDLTTSTGKANVGMMAVFAEFELNRIRERTREALRILKGRGVLLGASRPECRNLTAEGRTRGIATAARNRTARAIDDQSDIASIATEMRSQGASLRTIAAHLNAEGFPTREGSEYEEDPENPGKPKPGQQGWQAVQVKRVLDRIKPA